MKRKQLTKANMMKRKLLAKDAIIWRKVVQPVQVLNKKLPRLHVSERLSDLQMKKIQGRSSQRNGIENRMKLFCRCLVLI